MSQDVSPENRQNILRHFLVYVEINFQSCLSSRDWCFTPNNLPKVSHTQGEILSNYASGENEVQ